MPGLRSHHPRDASPIGQDQDPSRLLDVREHNPHAACRKLADLANKRTCLCRPDGLTGFVVAREVHLKEAVGRGWAAVLLGPHLGALDPLDTGDLERERALFGVPGLEGIRILGVLVDHRDLRRHGSSPLWLQVVAGWWVRRRVGSPGRTSAPVRTACFHYTVQLVATTWLAGLNGGEPERTARHPDKIPGCTTE